MDEDNTFDIWTDTDCPDECEPHLCRCDEAFPSASIVVGCFIAAMLLIAVAVVGASL